jgi:hypothetical protein
VSGASKKIESAVDAARRQMVRAAVKQQQHTTALSMKMETWGKHREEHRGWMKVVIVAWAHVARQGERVQQLGALTRGEIEARRESKRGGVRTMITTVSSSSTSRKVMRCSEEAWWARLKQKTKVLTFWATHVKGNTEQWLIRGRGTPVTDGAVRREAQASNENEEERKERKQRRVCAAKSTKEGIRLWWWMAGGKGADARGPRSVRTGTRVQTHAGPDAETATWDGRKADESGVAAVDGADSGSPRGRNFEFTQRYGRSI